MEVLLNGGSIAFAGKNYRIRDKDSNPVMTIRYSTFIGYTRHCRKVKGVFVINKKKILSYHGKSWIKKRYKELRNKNSNNDSSNQETGS